MAYRTVELTLISAKDLKDVNLLHKMEVYAEVVLSTDPRSKQRTSTDHEGLKNPTWNSTLKFTVPADTGATGTFNIMLRAERSLGDRDVGEVHIALKEILEAATGDGPTQPKFVSYQVWKPSGKPKGVLNISYKLSERITANTSCSAKPAKTGCISTASYQPPQQAATSPFPPPPPGYPTPGPGLAQPVTAYPAASSAPSTAYPAPPPQYGAPPPYTYAPPPQYGYGPPPPPQPGYGYPAYGYPPAAQAQPVKPKKNKKHNNGFGAGLIGGAIGGLIIGDIVADAAEDAYDAGYDDGFDDAGGFDF
ncbi:Calcium-dependent lipid-binding (CaLB domain) family protein [Rhynchospora pubera]|uniref:Calcium-dependent lipid-binding (CaLB domain) family protein n=1 Tax=Rhynchospora pubera TaxID=906938 RepID=A0AAV8EPM2_9POAL|nr:Calcium-dependent lipid-binding (CaLB domain) family protein [Rhynchospora pubera]